jgi:ubiquinone/menaquinone biosynthesis C-methylase UbiE
MPEATDYKRAAIEQWTADPSGANAAGGEPGSTEYVERLLEARHNYAAWMADELDYAGALGLDVLVVGCGQGIDVARYAQAGARATAIDLTPRHVELARAHLAALDLDATIELGDAESLPFDDGSFDRVSSNGVLHHTPDMHTDLAEIARVLRPGGEARIIVYNKRSFCWLKQVAGKASFVAASFASARWRECSRTVSKYRASAHGRSSASTRQGRRS